MGRMDDGTGMDSTYLRLWGKTNRRSGDDLRWHPTAFHCLDVAGCALALTEARPGPLRRQGEIIGMSERDVRGVIVTLAGVHDLGKFTRTFVSQVPALWPADLLGPPEGEHLPVRHGEALLRWTSSTRHPGIVTSSWPMFADLASKWPEDASSVRVALVAAVAGHHGSPVGDKRMPPRERERLTGQVLDDAAAGFLRDWFAIAPAARWTCPSPGLANRFAWFLAGSVMLADWLGSDRAKYRPSLRAGEVPTMPLARYWADVAVPAGREAVAAAGLRTPATRPFVRSDARHVVGVGELRPMQAAAADADLGSGPVLAIVEDVTGEGKTIVGEILAHRLMAAGRAEGLFQAMPTMATSGAAFDDLRKVAANFYEDEATPSLALVHGRSHLDPRFARVSMPDASGSVASTCTEWMRSERTKALLADVGAGTLDQALLGVLPVNSQAVRLAALSDRVVIADEVHAYDAYTGTLLATLVAAQAALGGSTVLLSATLPAAIRDRLTEAFLSASGMSVRPPATGDPAEAYPLLTIVSRGRVARTHVPTPGSGRRRVAVERLASVDDAYALVTGAHVRGRAVAYVRNTVRDAIATADALRADGIPVILFHARMALGDRLAVEAEVLRLFGRDATPAERTSCVLVATQVVEQSLNLDLDVIVTDLAPIDLLMQRAGRMWRYLELRTAPSRGMERPTLHVVSPDPAVTVGPGWVREALRGTAAVYRDHALLWRTARVLFAAGGFDLPCDLRVMVADVYAERAEVPAGLRGSHDRVRDVEHDHATSAGHATIRIDAGFVPEGSWTSESAALTRLSDGSARFALARVEGGRVVPWCAHDDPVIAWALSELSLRPSVLAEADVPVAWAAEVRRVQANELSTGTNVLILSGGDDGWSATGSNAAGSPCLVRYDNWRGLGCHVPG